MRKACSRHCQHSQAQVSLKGFTPSNPSVPGTAEGAAAVVAEFVNDRAQVDVRETAPAEELLRVHPPHVVLVSRRLAGLLQRRLLRPRGIGPRVWRTVRGCCQARLHRTRVRTAQKNGLGRPVKEKLPLWKADNYTAVRTSR